MTDAAGMWTTDKSFVKAGASEILGYPLTGGGSDADPRGRSRSTERSARRRRRSRRTD
ncbi:hypothetical protein NKH77_27740 [Streptomyces sp. M19]